MRLIDADALFTAFENAGWYDNNDRDLVAEDILMDAPTVEHTAPEGKWVFSAYYGAGGKEYALHNCSVCGCLSLAHGQENFCSNCGSKMKEDTA